MARRNNRAAPYVALAAGLKLKVAVTQSTLNPIKFTGLSVAVRLIFWLPDPVVYRTTADTGQGVIYDEIP